MSNPHGANGLTSRSDLSDHTASPWNALELARQALFFHLKVFRSRNNEYSRTEKVHVALWHFLRELFAIPGGRTEMIQRGRSFTNSISTCSDYYYAKCDAMYWADKVRGRRKEFDACIARLRSGPLHDLGLHEPDRLISEAKSLLPRDLHRDAYQSFVQWHKACQQVRTQSDATGAEGCSYLLSIAASIENMRAPRDPDDSDSWPSASAEFGPQWIRLCKDEIEKACLSLVEWAKHRLDGPDLTHKSVAESPSSAEGSSPSSSKGRPAKPKASTERGETQAKIVGALNKHHGYGNGSCLVYEPIGVRELAKKAEVGPSSVSEFFAAKFKGYAIYKRGCGDKVKFNAAMQLLNGDVLPKTVFYGRSPDTRRDREDE